MSPHLLSLAPPGIPLGASALCLLNITVERFLSVVNPFRHQNYMTVAVRYALAVFSWLLPTVILIVLPFLPGKVTQVTLLSTIGGQIIITVLATFQCNSIPRMCLFMSPIS